MNSAPQQDAAAGDGFVPPHRVSYFARHWNGELPLGVSYWINGSLFSLLLVILVNVSDALLTEAPLYTLALVGLIRTPLVFGLWVWSSVGIWRSATNHPARGGKKGWAVAAKTMIFIGALSGGLALAETVPVIREFALIVSGNDPMGRVQTRISANGAALHLSGLIGEGSASQVRTVLESAPSVQTLVLDSSGGWIREAELIAKYVRERGLNTYVESECESACTYIFVAGLDRAATPNARIGFHRPGQPGYGGAAPAKATQEMLAVYRQAGLSTAFLERVRDTPPDSMWYPSHDELVSYGVITRVSLGGEHASVVTRSREELDEHLRATPLVAALDRRFPGSLDSIAKAAWETSEQGVTDAHVLAAARGIVLTHLPALVAQADGPQLEEFFDITLEQIRAAHALGSEACELYMQAKLDVVSTLPPETLQRERDWLLLMLDSPPVRQPAPDAAIVELVLEKVSGQLPAVYLEVLRNPDTQSNLQCSAVLALYEAVKALPYFERGIALRGLFQGDG